MRSIGCLGLIILIGVAVYFLATTADLSSEQCAQVVGQKAHRGWNQVRKFVQNAQEGWQNDPNAAQKIAPAIAGGHCRVIFRDCRSPIVQRPRR